MTRDAKVIALLALVLVVALGARSCVTETAIAQKLAAAQDSLAAARAEASQALGVAAVFRAQADSFRQVADSLHLASDRSTRRAAIAIANLPPTPTFAPPDTCRPWAERATRLADALDLTRAVVDTLTLENAALRVAEGAARAAADTLGRALERARDRFVQVGDILPAAPITRPEAGLTLQGEARASLGGVSGSVTLQRGAVFAGVESVSIAGRMEQRAVVGVRKALRLW